MSQKPQIFSWGGSFLEGGVRNVFYIKLWEATHVRKWRELVLCAKFPGPIGLVYKANEIKANTKEKEFRTIDPLHPFRTGPLWRKQTSYITLAAHVG